MFDQLLFKTKKCFFLILCGIGLPTLGAQELNVSSSGEGSGVGGGVSYSVGQTFYSTNVGATGTESQGIQQAYDITVVFSAQEGAKSKNIVLIAQDESGLAIELESPSLAQFSYQLVNLQGEILAENSLHLTHTRISMDGYSDGVYFIKINRDGYLIKSFQVNKKATK